MKAAAVIALQSVDFSSHDILLVHCEGLGDLVLSQVRDVPAVCFCHTPLRPVFDRHYRHRVLERYGGARRIAFELLAAGFQYVDRRMWRRYHYVFFNSRETLTRARRGGLLRGLEGRYEVLHPGIDWSGCQPTWHYEPYFLLPGRIMWTKNIETAIQGFLQFKAAGGSHGTFRLVVAGIVDRKSEPYREKLQELSARRDDIEFVISPSEGALRQLYADCYAVLFPSFNEDWGIVPLEANAFGKPVIASDCGGPRESQQHGRTGYLVEPEPGAFARAMACLAENRELVHRMGVVARENAKNYDWSAFVDRTDHVLESLARGDELWEAGQQLAPVA